MSVNFNDSEEFVKSVKIFNDGKAEVVENVKLRIEKKTSTEDDKHPNYKLIATDSTGAEINEGYYYQQPDSDAFNKYQAQRLIMLARGVFGDDVKFPIFNNPTEALDGVMKMVAPELGKKAFRVAACYGTTKRPSQYLGFKSFGRFIQSMSEPSNLAFEKSDNLVRTVPAPTAADVLISDMNVDKKEGLSWMDAQ